VGRYLKEQNPNIRIVGVDIKGAILKELWENRGKVHPGVEARPTKSRALERISSPRRWI